MLEILVVGRQVLAFSVSQLGKIPLLLEYSSVILVGYLPRYRYLKGSGQSVAYTPYLVVMILLVIYWLDPSQTK